MFSLKMSNKGMEPKFPFEYKAQSAVKLRVNDLMV